MWKWFLFLYFILSRHYKMWKFKFIINRTWWTHKSQVTSLSENFIYWTHFSSRLDFLLVVTFLSHKKFFIMEKLTVEKNHKLRNFSASSMWFPECVLKFFIVMKSFCYLFFGKILTHPKKTIYYFSKTITFFCC